MKRRKEQHAAATRSDELEEYLAEVAMLEEDVDEPIKWWREKEKKYPRLAKVALHHLSVPATSAPVERIFSVGGYLMRPHRAIYECSYPLHAHDAPVQR